MRKIGKGDGKKNRRRVRKREIEREREGRGGKGEQEHGDCFYDTSSPMNKISRNFCGSHPANRLPCPRQCASYRARHNLSMSILRGFPSHCCCDVSVSENVNGSKKQSECRLPCNSIA